MKHDVNVDDNPRYATILTCRRILMFLGVSWALVLASSLPPLLGICGLVTNYRPGQPACLPDWTGSRVGLLFKSKN